MYTPKPFPIKESNALLDELTGEFDDKRTLCNVIRYIFESIQDDSYNLNVARCLVLEAFWMAKRMHSKLNNQEKEILELESVENNSTIIHEGELYYTDESDDEYAFTVDWKQFPARGNWD